MDSAGAGDRAGTDLDLYAEDVRAGLPSHTGWAAMALADRGDLIEAPLAIRDSKQRGVTALSAAYGMRGLRLYRRRPGGGRADVGALAPHGVMRPQATSPTGFRQPEVSCRAGRARCRPGTARARLAGASRAPGFPALSCCSRAGEFRSLSGRHAEARHDFLAAGERVRLAPLANPELLGWRTGLALAEGALGNGEEAQRLAAEAVRLAREAGGRAGSE